MSEWTEKDVKEISVWNESAHPRDKDGKFSDKSASELKSELMRELPEKEKFVKALRQYSDESNKDMRAKPLSKGKNKSQEEFFGEEFKSVKGVSAIEKLLQERRGHVKNAFERSEIGGIDLVWGDENGGLLHTIQKRDKLLDKGKGTISGIDIVYKIPEIIEKGKFFQDEKGRLNIDYEGYRVGIMPTFYQDKINWIVTAMEKWQ